MFFSRKLDLLVPLLILVFGQMTMAKIPAVRNLDSPIFFKQMGNERISLVTFSFGGSVRVPESISIAISPRQAFTFDEIFTDSPRVAKILNNCAIFSISVEFPTPLAKSTVDGPSIFKAVRGLGTNSVRDTSNSKSNILKQVPQEYGRNNKQKPIHQVIVM